MFEFCNLKWGPDKEKTTKADNRAETCEVLFSLSRDNHALSLNIIGFTLFFQYLQLYVTEILLHAGYSSTRRQGPPQNQVTTEQMLA